MTARLLPAILLLVAMIAAPTLAAMLTPKPISPDPASRTNFEELIPRQFGDWREDPRPVAIVVNPQQKELLDRLYSQTISRTYIGPNGARMMLSIAYGDQYGKGMETHKPEVCYPAQGFKIVSETSLKLPVDEQRSIPARNLVATSWPRVEPITYWLVVGEAATGFGFKMRLQQVKMGLTGRIPDGLLFRVSMINPDEKEAFALEHDFARQLIAAIPTEKRHLLIGRQ